MDCITMFSKNTLFVIYVYMSYHDMYLILVAQRVKELVRWWLDLVVHFNAFIYILLKLDTEALKHML